MRLFFNYFTIKLLLLWLVPLGWSLLSFNIKLSNNNIKLSNNNIKLSNYNIKLSNNNIKLSNFNIKLRTTVGFTFDKREPPGLWLLLII